MSKHLIACLLTLAAGISQATPAEAPIPVLHVLAESRESIWNAVAVDDDGRVYLAGPRWAGSRGPSVARLAADGSAQPYPDAAWNGDDVARSAERRFINVNAIHRDGRGQLWIVDTGVTGFGGTVIPGAAKLVVVDLASARVSRVILLPAEVARPHSYVDDIRFKGDKAYLTDAGEPGLIVLDIPSGKARRVLDASPATRAGERDIVIGGEVLRAPDGTPLRVNADPLELSPDGEWLYFAPLAGPWSRIETRWLDDEKIDAAALAAKVSPWRDLPPVGGTTIDRRGNFYFTDLAANALKRLAPDGREQTVIADPRLHWVDAPTFDALGNLYLPVPQIDRVTLFQGGKSRVQWPVRVYRIDAAELAAR